jgi:hypothetical protein
MYTHIYIISKGTNSLISSFKTIEQELTDDIEHGHSLNVTKLTSNCSYILCSSNIS